MADAGSSADVFRRALGLVSTLALLGLAIGFYRSAPGQTATMTAPPPASTAASLPSPTPIGTRTPSRAKPPSRSPTPSATRTNTPEKPPKGMPEGPGTTEPGILLIATPDARGRFDIAELVRLEQPVTLLQLRPIDVRAAGVGLDRARPVATQIQVTADEQALAVPRDRVSRATVLTLDAPTEVFQLRYVLRGVTERTPNSSPGRALGAVGPLVAGVPGDLPVAVVVIGRSVRNLGCPSSEMVRRPCATGQPPRLRVNRNLPHRAALVTVQLDLRGSQ